MSDAPKGGGAPLMIPLWVVPKLNTLDADPYLVIHKLWEHVQSAGLTGRIHVDDVPGATGRLLSKARLDKAIAQLLRPVVGEGDKVEKLWIDWIDDHIVLPAWWMEENPPPGVWHDDVERFVRARRRELNSAKMTWLRDLVRERDRNLCRYCGLRVKWDAHNADHGGSFDHIDPEGPNTPENVVVACRRCNGRKGHRTPEQWVLDDPRRGLTLLPAGTLAADSAAVRARGAPPPGSTKSNRSSTRAQPRLNDPARTGATPPRVELEPNRSRTAPPRPAPPRPNPSRSAGGPR